MKIHRLTPANAAEYRELMLGAYAADPASFIATAREREPLPNEWWESRLSDRPEARQAVFGAFAGGRLGGAVGLRLESRERTAHKATLFGMAVLPPFRGRGIGRALVEAALDHARSAPGTEVVQLTVMKPNRLARNLYEACGFRPFALEPRAVKIGGRFISLVHMWRGVGGKTP